MVTGSQSRVWSGPKVWGTHSKVSKLSIYRSICCRHYLPLVAVCDVAKGSCKVGACGVLCFEVAIAIAVGMGQLWHFATLWCVLLELATDFNKWMTQFSVLELTGHWALFVDGNSITSCYWCASQNRNTHAHPPTVTRYPPATESLGTWIIKWLLSPMGAQSLVGYETHDLSTQNRIFSLTYYLELRNVVVVYCVSQFLPTWVELVGWTFIEN